MEYVLLKYRDRPDEVVGLAATMSASEAVEIALRWSHGEPHLGLIVTIGQRAIVHCTPRTD